MSNGTTSERVGSIPRAVSGERAAAKSRLFTTDSIATGLTVAAVLCAVTLRWLHLGARSLYVDEGQTNFAASLSPLNIIRFAQSSDAPPLYFLLLHYWRALFGNSESALRAMSAFFGTLSLPVFYLLAKKVLRDSMAVAVAMLLFAFSAMQLWYSQEARSYELGSFLALVGIYGLVLFLERRSAGLFATIVLSMTAVLYTHNMMLFYVVALGVVWLIYPSQRNWSQRFRELLFAGLLIGLLYLPWVPSLLGQANVDVVQKYFWSPRPAIWTLLAAWRFVAGFNWEYLGLLSAKFLPLSFGTTRILVGLGLGLICAVLIAGGLVRVPKPDRHRNVSLILYGLVPMLLVFALSQITTPLFINRIFIISSVIAPIVFASPVAWQKGPRGRVLFAFLGLALAAATALSGFGYLRYQQKDNWRGAIKSVVDIPEPNRLIVFIPRMGELLFDYYAQRSPGRGLGLSKLALPVSYLEAFPPPIGGRIQSTQLNRLKLAVESGKYSEVDMILSDERHDDPNETALGYLNQVFSLREEQRFTGPTGIRVVRFMSPPT